MTTIAETIYAQLGGRRFSVMTGARNLVAGGSGLSMQLPRNGSGANALEITLGSDDLYTMRFYRYTTGRLDKKTGEFTPPTQRDVQVFGGVYCDQLRPLFEQVTGMYTIL